MNRQETVFQTGEIVGERYEILEELGRGSYGVVYRAIQLGIQRVVALKTLLPKMAVDSEEHQRFEREALLVSHLNHPNIITLFDYGKHQGVLFMVMEFVEGKSLGDLIKEQAPLGASVVRSLTHQMLDALQFAHDQGVVHRDLKPENIKLIKNMDQEERETYTVKILDFGIGKFVHGDKEGSALDTLTQTGIALGTPQYMSPENITGDPVSHLADVYAIGLIVYEMLIGTPAFQGTNPHVVMVSHIKDPPPELPDTTEMYPYHRALEWALRKQPDERAPSARALKELIEEDVRLLEGTGPAALLASNGKEIPLGREVPFWAVVIAALLVAFLALFALFSGTEEEGVREPLAQVAENQVIEEREESPGEEIFVEEIVDEELAGAVRGQDEEEAEKDQEARLAESERRSGGTENEISSQSPLAEERRRGAGRPVVVEDDEAPSQEERRVVNEVQREIWLEIQSQPEGAIVTINDTPVGTTPWRRRYQRGEQGIRIGFSLTGYRDTVVEVVPNEDRKVNQRLERARIDLIR